ncbi:MAG: hypothetical protein AAB557_05280 [Patescibacteria group bacterium]
MKDFDLGFRVNRVKGEGLWGNDVHVGAGKSGHARLGSAVVDFFVIDDQRVAVFDNTKLEALELGISVGTCRDGSTSLVELPLGKTITFQPRSGREIIQNGVTSLRYN